MFYLLVYTNLLTGKNISTHINVIGLSRNNISNEEIEEIEHFIVKK